MAVSLSRRKPQEKIMRIFRVNANRERGAVAIIFGLTLVIFVGIASLAIDTAYAYVTKRDAQAVADAAALSAAYARKRGETDTAALTQVVNATVALINSLNLFNLTVPVNPTFTTVSQGTPTRPVWKASVTIASDSPTFFLGAFRNLSGSTQGGGYVVTAAAQSQFAPATAAPVTDPCIQVRNTAAANAIYMEGGHSNLDQYTVDCGVQGDIYVASLQQNAVKSTGDDSRLRGNLKLARSTLGCYGPSVQCATASTIAIKPAQEGKKQVYGGVITRSATLSDSYNGVAAPTYAVINGASPPACTTQTSNSTFNNANIIQNGRKTLPNNAVVTGPKVFCNGFLIASGASVTFNGYIEIRGSTSGHATTIAGRVSTGVNGTLIYYTATQPITFDLTTSNPATLTAMTRADAYNGIVLWGTSAVTHTVINNVGPVFNGAVYTPLATWNVVSGSDLTTGATRFNAPAGFSRTVLVTGRITQASQARVVVDRSLASGNGQPEIEPDLVR